MATDYSVLDYRPDFGVGNYRSRLQHQKMINQTRWFLIFLQRRYHLFAEQLYGAHRVLVRQAAALRF